MSSDIEIARKAYLEPIMDVGAKLDIPFKALRPYGHFKAKLSSSWLENKPENKVEIYFNPVDGSIVKKEMH